MGEATQRDAQHVVKALVNSERALEGRVAVCVVDGRPMLEIDADLDGALLELRPADVREVPVWVTFEHGVADLGDVGFEPESVSLVHWDTDHRRRGLIAGFPQLLLSPAVAGTRRRSPVAGGRRADGLLELWVEASAAGEVIAVVDASETLGPTAQLRWTSGSGRSDGLTVAVPVGPRGRRLGVASLPVDPVDGLTRLQVLVEPAEAVAGPR